MLQRPTYFFECHWRYFTSFVYWAACTLLLPLSGSAQNGWISATGAVQHSYYSVRHHTEVLQPSVASEYGVRYRHAFGKGFGLVLGWRYGERSYTLVRSPAFDNLLTPRHTEFNVIENALLAGLCKQLRERSRWEWHVVFAIEGRFSHSVQVYWKKGYFSYTPEGSDQIKLPGRVGFRLGLRCTWKPTQRFSVILEPHVLLVPRSRFEYVPLPDHSGDKIFVGETRCAMGADLGIELGPLFKRAASHAPAD